MPGSCASYVVLDGKYKIMETVGTGGFGKVKKAIHIATGEKVAIKVMDKKSLGDDLPRTKLEIEALQDLCHQNICKLYEVIETPTKIFLVLEYCSGGELFDYIVERDRLEEGEARYFFRQIVAAVAYIHTQGYAHRDLKPENLLIDDEQNIKVIDFGLCAKPKGGMGSRLETFCGSPAYAAPELINGQEYLGSQVDIWSMGVLLYALLCGYLPFDDENVGTLYRKIQNGRYECPYWLSEGSRNLLSKMLVTHPMRRITVGSLLIHPWLNEGYGESIKWPSIYKKNYLDESIICEMSLCYGQPKHSILNELQNWKYDYMTATYFLLLLKKRKGRALTLTSPLPLKEKSNNRSNMSWDLGGSLESGLNNAELLTLGSPKRDETPTVVTPSKPTRKPIDISDDKTSDELIISDKENFAIPPPPSHRKSRRGKTEIDANGNPITPVSLPNERKVDVFASPALNSSIEKRSHSIDVDLHQKSVHDHSIAQSPLATPTKDRSSSSARKVFGSIEKRLDKVKNMLTPKKKFGDLSTLAAVAQTPRKVKDMNLYNVSVIQGWENADSVLDTLKRALEVKGIPCKQKGYTLRNKLKDDRTGKVMLEFELEICRLTQGEEMICVCRKRLKGDAWLYKNLVEEILKALNSNARANRALLL